VIAVLLLFTMSFVLLEATVGARKMSDLKLADLKMTDEIVRKMGEMKLAELKMAKATT